MYGLCIESRHVVYYVRYEVHPVTRGRWTTDPADAARWPTEEEAREQRRRLDVGGRPQVVELPALRGRCAALEVGEGRRVSDPGTPDRRWSGLEV